MTMRSRPRACGFSGGGEGADAGVHADDEADAGGGGAARMSSACRSLRGDDAGRGK